MSATPPSIAIAAPVIGGPEVVRVVLESSSTATPPSIAIAAPVLGGPEVVHVVLESSSTATPPSIAIAARPCLGVRRLCARVVLNSSSTWLPCLGHVGGPEDLRVVLNRLDLTSQVKYRLDLT